MIAPDQKREVKCTLHDDKGTWAVRGRVYSPKLGKYVNRSESTGLKVKDNTKRKAQKMMQEIASRWEMESNAKKADCNTLFSYYLDRWFDTKKDEVKGNSLKSYTEYRDVYVEPMLGGLKVVDIGKEHLETFCKLLINKHGLSVKSVRKIMVVVYGGLSEAEEDKIIPTNFKGSIKLPKPKKYEGAAYSEEDLSKLLQRASQIGEPIMSAILLSSCYGLRQSEVLGLRWKDISFQEGILYVRNTVVQNGSLILEEERTKSQKSRRKIALIPYTVPYFQNLKNTQKGNNLVLDKVCRWPDGKDAKGNYLTKKLHKIQNDCGLEKIRFHDLRGTAASLLHKGGLTIKQLQEFLGHEDASTTINNYIHTLNKEQREASEKMDAILKNSEFCSENCSE